MKKEIKEKDIFQFVWYSDTGNIFKREKKGKFVKSNKSELASFMFDNSDTFVLRRRKTTGVKKITFHTITKN